jgi:K319-like protein/FG-GAP repeat protein
MSPPLRADGAVVTRHARFWERFMTHSSRTSASRPISGAVIAAVHAAAMAVLTAAPVLKVTVLPVPNPAPVADGEYGEAVSGIGDVNADGVADLLVGAPGQDRVYVLSGATRSAIRTIEDPEGLTGNRFGYAVDSMPDLNGDSVQEILVGAPGPLFASVPLPCVVEPCPPPDPQWGRAFVISGATGAVIHKLTPVTDFLGFGVSVASPGDVTGDSISDVVVGMVPFGLASAFGRVYAFSGANKALLWAAQEPGGKQLASFGLRVTTISDLTGDSRRDILVGAPFHDVNPDPNVTLSAGEAYLLSGANGAIVRTTPNPSPSDGDLFGLGLAAVGDQTGDGKEDYVIGEPGAGLVTRINGATGGSPGAVTSPEANDQFGFAIANAGDQDGDGLADFWVGAPNGRTVQLRSWSGASLAKATDPANGPAGSFGFSVAATGDIGGGGTPDLIVGSPQQSAKAGLAFVVTLAVNTPPVADAGPDQVLECGGPAGSGVVLNGSASSDADGDSLTYEWRNSANVVVATTAIAPVTLGLGTHAFTLTVSDGFESDSDTVVIVVADTTPPALTVTVDPALLWPPNHTLVPIAADVNAVDVCDPTPSIALVSIVANEPDDGTGDGETVGDIQEASPGSDDRAFLLRAERSGGGSGRTYDITYTATDGSGNPTTASASVTVPRSLGK